VTASLPLRALHYSDLRDSLSHLGAVVALPEAHGGISGALCTGGPAAAQLWLDDAFADPSFDGNGGDGADGADPNAAEIRAPLHELVAATWAALDGEELAFEPLLPDDDAPLEEQVAALAAWCHGFLGSLGLNAPDIGRRADATRQDAVSAVVEEIITDFAEISRAGLTDDDQQERDEADFALVELKEYVRVSVQIVFDELTARRAAARRDVH
jgi:uncharacterized protein